MKRKRRGTEAGFTLIELLVGALLLLIVMAGFLPFFLQGLSQTSAARFKSMATNIAREKVEQIRQLDYREITADPAQPRNLYELFGSSVLVPERNMTYLIDYSVVENAMPGQAVKSVEVTVTWDAPPRPSPAVVKTLIAQQYLGPRGGWLEVSNTSQDDVAPGGTPFPLLCTSGLDTSVKYHIAQSDWFMAYTSMSSPLPSPNDISLKSLFRNDSGGVACPIEVSNSDLNTTLSGSPAMLSDVWFEYSFDARTIPDGYWDLLVTMYNKYKQPGNTWDLRVRVEQGPPMAPQMFTATGVSDTQIRLSWQPGEEQDRARYVLERRKQNADGTWPNAWTTVNPNLPPNTAAYTDNGVVNTVDPWGSASQNNRYQYRVYGVDTGGRSAPDSPSNAAVSGAVTLPPVSAVPQVAVPSVTGLALNAAKTSLAAEGLTWTVTETIDTTHAVGTVLTQSPAAGTLIDQNGAVALTVAAASAPPSVNYVVTINKTNNPERTIVVLDSGSAVKFSGPARKQTPIVLNLPNGHYTIHLDTSLGAQLGDFTVNGANLPVTIP
jgi:Tfp pilus assembly protein PilV